MEEGKMRCLVCVLHLETWIISELQLEQKNMWTPEGSHHHDRSFRAGRRYLSAFFASICIDNTGAVRDTPMMLTLMCSRRKAGKVWLKPKQMWVAQVAEANQPIQKVGLAGAGSHSGPEGSWVTCQVSEWRAIAHCFINWPMSYAWSSAIRITYSPTPDGCFLFAFVNSTICVLSIWYYKAALKMPILFFNPGESGALTSSL